MDKKKICYTGDHQELIIESIFISETSIQEIIKEYILKTQQNQTNHTMCNVNCYDKNIVATPKEVC